MFYTLLAAVFIIDITYRDLHCRSYSWAKYRPFFFAAPLSHAHYFVMWIELPSARASPQFNYRGNIGTLFQSYTIFKPLQLDMRVLRQCRYAYLLLFIFIIFFFLYAILFRVHLKSITNFLNELFFQGLGTNHSTGDFCSVLFLKSSICVELP